MRDRETAAERPLLLLELDYQDSDTTAHTPNPLFPPAFHETPGACEASTTHTDAPRGPCGSAPAPRWPAGPLCCSSLSLAAPVGVDQDQGVFAVEFAALVDARRARGNVGLPLLVGRRVQEQRELAVERATLVDARDARGAGSHG